MIDRCLRDLGSERRSPFEHRNIGGKSSATDKLLLNRAMLDKLNAYLDNGRAGHETVNVLRLMLYTGAGPAEIGGLAVSDVSLESPIPYIRVRENGIRRIKTATRPRVIPLVGPALAAAKDAVERADGRERLFTSYSSARGADSLSAKLNKALRTAGIPHSPRLTSYSLRHSMSEALRLSGASYSIQRRLLGHSARDISDHYGSPAAMLQEARAALEAALPHLGEVDDSVYSPAERL